MTKLKPLQTKGRADWKATAEQWYSIALAYKNSLKKQVARRVGNRQFLKPPEWKSRWEQLVSKLRKRT